MQDTHLRARSLIKDHTITLEELYIQWWANGGMAGQPELGIRIDGPLDFTPSDLLILGWAMEELDLNWRGRRTANRPQSSK